jgi:Protein of unknown function (DUF2934)
MEYFASSALFRVPTKMHMSDNRSEATEEEIAACAYFIWEEEGNPIGRALDHWLQAELQLAASLWHESLRYEEARTSADTKTGEHIIFHIPGRTC